MAGAKKAAMVEAKAEPPAEAEAALAPHGKDGPRKGGGRKKLILLAVPLLLAGAGGGLWFSGILPHLLGMDAKAAATAAAASAPPVFVEIPELVANLNAGERRSAYVKLQARIELAPGADTKAVATEMPRLQDLFQTYLREMRPEELRGSAGTWRLREELIARADAALAPIQVQNVLFTELLIQ